MRRMLTKPIRRHLLAAGAAIPLLVWWLGFQPGFGHSDTIDQWTQLTTGNYYLHHSPLHTYFMDVFSFNGTRPGLVTFFQLLVLVTLLVYAAKWLIKAGVPAWLTVGTTWLIGFSPAIAPTTLALWKDVPFGLMTLWAWIELLALKADDDRSERPWSWVRLGTALAGMWLFRSNGPLTVLAVLIVVGWIYRREWRRTLIMFGTGALLILVVIGPGYRALDVGGASIEPSQVFLPDIAAAFNANPERFTTDELRLMVALAPLEVWRGRYDCFDSNALLFDPQFNHDPIRNIPGPYRALVIAVYTRDPGTVLSHRRCAANFVYMPPQPAEAYFHRPPYDFPPNDVGLVRDPISQTAFMVTDRLWRWAERDEILWLTWRPAIVILPALGAVILFAIRPRARRFLLPSALLIAHVLNLVATSPVQEFRYAYPVYLVGILTLPLLRPALRMEPRQLNRV